MDAAHVRTHPRILQLEHTGRAAPLASRLTHRTEHWLVDLSDGGRVRVATELPIDIVDELHELGLDPCEVHRLAGEHAIHEVAAFGGLDGPSVVVELGWNEVCPYVRPVARPRG